MRDDRRRFGGLLVMTTATLLAIVVAGFATFLAGALGFFVATGLLVAAYAATRRVARRRRS